MKAISTFCQMNFAQEGGQQVGTEIGVAATQKTWPQLQPSLLFNASTPRIYSSCGHLK